MSYMQLKPTNLSIVGVEGFCLVYAREIFGVAAKYPTAAAGWQGAQYKHAGEQPPTDVSVPVWYSWETSGHVAVSVPGKGVYSTTVQGDKVFANVQLCGAYVRATYLGWSEDINGVRVVQPSAAPSPPPTHQETVKPVTWNVRSAPTTNAAILGVVKGGQTFTTTIVTDGWRQINFGGKTGYVGPAAWAN